MTPPDANGPRANANSRRRTEGLRFLLPAAVALVSFAAFSPALHADFVDFDDHANFTDNPHYRGFSPVQLRWMFTEFNGHYQPVTWLSHALDWTLWGLDPRGYHAVNLLVHAGSALLFYWLLLDLLPRARGLGAARGTSALRWAAACGALLFAVHPLRVESVVWATERKDVLYLFFALASLLFYLRAQRGLPARGPGDAAARLRGAPALVLSVGCFALSMLSKAMSMTLPALLLVLDAYPLGRLRSRRDLGALLREKIPYFVILAAGMAAEVYAEHAGGSFDPESSYGLGDVLSQPAYRLGFYVWKTLAPTGLYPIYLLPRDRDPGEPVYLLSAAAIVAVTVVLLLLVRRAPALLTGWLAFGLLLAPVLGLVHAGYHFAADRNTYFAGTVPATLVAGGLAHLLVRRRHVWGSAAAVLCVLAVLGGLSYRQSRVWHDSITLWRHTIALDPDNYVAQYNLAYEFAEQGDYDRAVEHYTRAIDARNDEAKFFYNRGLAYFQQSRYVLAIADFDRASRLDPEHWLAVNNRGAGRLQMHDYAGAEADFTRVIEMQPDRPGPYQSRARARAAQGNVEGARRDAETAERLARGGSARSVPAPAPGIREARSR